jgi:uncharacterized protein YprB with RNaseH-like and TPR domain
MKLGVQDFLRLVEESKSLVFFDIESTGLKGDYGSALVISVKHFGSPPISFVVSQVGHDQKIVKEARDYMGDQDCWVSYYGKGFDIPFLNTRLLRWGLEPMPSKPHIDMYFVLRSHIATGRRSQAHLLEWLQTKQKKMTVSANTWAEIASNPSGLKIMRQRCDSDTAGLEALYRKTKHLIRDIKS